MIDFLCQFLFAFSPSTSTCPTYESKHKLEKDAGGPDGQRGSDLTIATAENKGTTSCFDSTKTPEKELLMLTSSLKVFLVIIILFGYINGIFSVYSSN